MLTLEATPSLSGDHQTRRPSDPRRGHQDISKIATPSWVFWNGGTSFAVVPRETPLRSGQSCRPSSRGPVRAQGRGERQTDAGFPIYMGSTWGLQRLRRTRCEMDRCLWSFLVAHKTQRLHDKLYQDLPTGQQRFLRALPNPPFRRPVESGAGIWAFYRETRWS